MVVYVAHSSACEYIMEGEIIEKRANWITKILEYDIEVKPIKTVLGIGLCKYLAHDKEMVVEEEQLELVLTNESNSKGCWLADRVRFMHIKKYLPSLPSQKKRFYKL